MAKADRGTVQVCMWARYIGWVPIAVRPALRCGVWAVTPLLTSDHEPVRGRWVITHVPTGIKASSRACDSMTLAAARRLCRELGELLPDFGERARFGQRPRKMTSERWKLARALCTGREP